MPEWQNHRASARRAFVIAPYAPTFRMTLAPAVPSRCPRGDVEARSCAVFTDHWRARKTGPAHPLLVARCRVHRVAFTVYPPAHVPYGRQRLVFNDVLPASPMAMEPGSSPPETLLDAAVDAAQGKAWARDDGETGGRRHRTQRRHIRRLEALCGLDPGLSDAERLTIAEVLGVSAMTLMEGVGAVAAQPGYQTRGSAIMRVVEAAARRGRLAERLSVSGHLAGLWGRPRVWDAAVGQLWTPFSGVGTRPPPGRK